MALFNLLAKKKKKRASEITYITKNIRITGELISASPLFIDSKIEGDLKVNNTVIISKRASVDGNIQAKNVLVYGEIRGKVKSKNLEVYQGAQVRGNLNVKKIYIDGQVFGSIGGEGVFIDKNGRAKSVIQAKKTAISGVVDGALASYVLELNRNSYIRGDVFVSEIPKKDGKIEGSINNFKDILSSKEQFSYDYEDSVEKMNTEVAVYMKYEAKIIDLIKRNLNNNAILQNLVKMLKYSEDNEQKLEQIIQAIEYKKGYKKDDGFIDVEYD
jgi:cytoskeletal protein CcmA (bactofilin family)